MIRSASLTRNVFSNWFVLGASVAYSLLITPTVVRALDLEQYGVWSFLNGLLSYSELLYMGLGSALVRSVAQHRASGDLAGINRVVSVVATIYGVIGAICFGALSGASAYVPHVFAEPLSGVAAQAASTTCVLLGLQLFFVFVGSAFSGLLAGHDRYDLVNAVYSVGILIRLVAVPILVRPGHDPLRTLAFVMAATTVLGTVLLVGLAFWHLPQLSIRVTRAKLHELRFLYSFGLQSFFIVFAVKLISYTDTTVIGITLGAASVALYVLPLQLVEYSRAFVGGFAGVFLPRLTVLATKGDMAAIRDAYLSTTRFSCFLSGWLAGGLIWLGPLFINRWVGQQFGTPVQSVVVFLAIASLGQVLSSQAPFAFYQALNLVAFPAIVLMGEALANLGLSVWLAPRLGIAGVALATVIPAVLMSLVILPPYLCRQLEIPVWTFIRSAVLPGGLVLAATLFTGWLASFVIAAESYTGILGRVLSTLPTAVVVFWATFPRDQTEAVLRTLRLSSSRSRGAGV